jgi:SAM-dependent methyltransferase
MRDIPPGPWLNVGSGPSGAGAWVNFDGSWQARVAGHTWLATLGRRVLGVDIGHWPKGVRYRDIRRGLPYRHDSVAVVYASHVLEHLHRGDTVRFLAHVRQLLKPGGVCRVVVPDLHAIVTWYLSNRDEPAAQKIGSSSDLLMGMLMLRGPEARSRNWLLDSVRRVADLHENKWM